MNGELGRLGNNGRVNIDYPVAIFPEQAASVLQQHPAINIPVLGVGIRKMPSDIA
jgi:hypothetical protein